MRAKKAMKAPFVVTISAVAAAASMTMACGGRMPGGVDDNPDTYNPPRPPPTASVSYNPPRPPDPPIGNPPPPQVCPAVEPLEGTACVSYDGATQYCKYVDACDSRPRSAGAAKTYECNGVVWKRTTPAYNAACPAQQPQQGESCASCAHDYPAECTYSLNTPYPCPPVSVHCDLGSLTWQRGAVASCNPPPPPFDAGAPIDP